MTQSEFDGYVKIWHAGNAAGDGFAVGRDTDTAGGAIARDGDRLVEWDDTPGRRIAIGETHGGRRYIVCDAHGPWAVWADWGAGQDYIVIRYRAGGPDEYEISYPVNTLDEIHEAKLAMADAGVNELPVYRGAGCDSILTSLVIVL
jgi:hypothetical protein